MYGWTIQEWRKAYAGAAATPQQLLGDLVVALRDRDDAVWLAVASDEQLAAQLAALREKPQALPLWGVPFAVKDNIDVAGWVTTAACPGFARLADVTAPGVQRLLDAGAILVGKTNLDQFATGLVGTRSPYGAVKNSFRPEYVSGGSSSGSAVAVATGLVPFALGTDTAGSGRVPAGFNNLVGIKPTRGAISSRGVLPACRTLDCISIFALDVADGDAVAQVMYHHDAADPYGRPAPAGAPATFGGALRLGIPAQPEFFGDSEAERQFAMACNAWRALGAELVRLDFTPLHEAAALLYDGPWVAERYAAVGDFIERGVDGIDPVVAAVVLKGKQLSALDTFRAEYRRAELKVVADALIGQVNALLVPTAPTHYTLEQMAADPITLNSRFGVYTNFVNLLDWSALALPGGMRSDGLPAGFTLIAPAWADAALLDLGYRWQRYRPWQRGALGTALPSPPPVEEPPADYVRLAVVGAHLTGMPLNHQLTDRAARFIEATHTANCYRLYALADTTPAKPGLVRAAEGAAIAVELWDVPTTAFGSFVAAIPPPLGIGTLELVDGRQVKGFICEQWALSGARDITHFGSWCGYLAARAEEPGQCRATPAPGAAADVSR